MHIAVDLSTKGEEELIKLFKEFKDVFAWSYKDLKEVGPGCVSILFPCNTMPSHAFSTLTLIMITLLKRLRKRSID